MLGIKTPRKHSNISTISKLRNMIQQQAQELKQIIFLGGKMD